MIDPKEMPLEWREKYPRVMDWKEVPEERKVTPEFVIFWRGDYGKDEAAGLASRESRCAMATDFGSRWGERLGMYIKCGNYPSPGETKCYQHGGKVAPKAPRKSHKKRALEKRKKRLEERMQLYKEKEKDLLALARHIKYDLLSLLHNHKAGLQEVINELNQMDTDGES